MCSPFRPEGCRGSRVRVGSCAAWILVSTGLHSFRNEVLPPYRTERTRVDGPAPGVLTIVALPLELATHKRQPMRVRQHTRA